MRSFGTTIDNLIDEELDYGASNYELIWYKNEKLVEVSTSKLRFHFGGPKMPIGNVIKDYIEIETDYMEFYKGDAIRLELKKGDASISVGPFYVDKFEKKKKATYVAYSSLLDLSKIKLSKYESSQSYACIKDMVAYYLTPLGITFDSNCPMINMAYYIEQWETFSIYDLIECVALTDACNFTLQGNVLQRADVQGSIAKVYQAEKVVYTNGKCKHEEDAYLDCIRMKYRSVSYSADGTNCEDAVYDVAPYGTQDNVLELSFKFIPNSMDVATQFYDNLITEDKVLLNDYEVPFLGDPRIEVGDVVSFESEDGTICTFRVGELIWEWDGGLKCIASTGSTTTIQSSAGGFTSVQQMADALVSMSNSLMTVRYNAVYTNQLYAKVAEFGFASVGELSAEVAKMGLMTAAEADIKYMTVSSADMKYATIDLSNIAVGTITDAMIANGAIGTAQIADGSITDAKIVGLTANKITAGTLDAGTIDVINLNAANITVGTINGKQIDGGAITTTHLKDDAVTSDKIAVSSILADHITAGAITTDKLVAEAVTGAKIAAGTITTEKLAASAITAAKIAAGTITATQIAGSTITADKLNVTSLSAISANLGTVTAGVIKSTNYAANSTGMKLDLSTGVWDSKNTKIAKDGAITCSDINITGGDISLIATSYDNAKITVSHTSSGATAYDGTRKTTISPYSVRVEDEALGIRSFMNSDGMVHVGNDSNFVDLYAPAQAVARVKVGSPSYYVYIASGDVGTSDGISLRGLNSNFANYIPLSGGTITGNITTNLGASFATDGNVFMNSNGYGDWLTNILNNCYKAYGGLFNTPTALLINGNALSHSWSQFCAEYNGSCFRIRNDGGATYFMNGNWEGWSNYAYMDTSGNWGFNGGQRLTAGGLVEGSGLRSTGQANATVSKSPNCWLSSDGTVMKSSTTSSARYKDDVTTDLCDELNPHNLYDIDVIQFKYKKDYFTNTEDIRYRKDLIGFIAEDVLEKYKIAADYYINEKGESVCEGWNPQYMIPAMLKLIQEQHKRIVMLEEKLVY